MLLREYGSRVRRWMRDFEERRRLPIGSSHYTVDVPSVIDPEDVAERLYRAAVENLGEYSVRIIDEEPPAFEVMRRAGASLSDIFPWFRARFMYEEERGRFRSIDPVDYYPTKELRELGAFPSQLYGEMGSDAEGHEVVTLTEVSREDIENLRENTFLS